MYFDDADREQALPRGMTATFWEETKAFFRDAGPALLALDRRDRSG